jgi:putative ABC transport system permease protein
VTRRDAGNFPTNQTWWRTATDRLRADLRLALRTLRRTPGFTVAAVAILGLGIGMATAMFTVFRVVLVDRLPVRDEQQLVVMHPLDRGSTHLDVPYPFLKAMARDSAVFRGVAGVYHLGAQPIPLTFGDLPMSVMIAQTSPNFFSVLGTRPLLGRLFRQTDGDVGAPPVAVLGYRAWRERFHEDSSVVGKSFVRIYDNQRVQIIGVAPPGFDYPSGADGWLQLPPSFTAQVDIVARLAPGVGIDAAKSDLRALVERVPPFSLLETNPDRFNPRIFGIEAHSFAETVLGDVRPTFIALTLAVALLLVIACVNVASLLLVRVTGRAREIAVRRAIGASVGDVLQQFAVESGTLGVAGGVAGFVCAELLLRAFVALAPRQLPRTDAVLVHGAPIAAVATFTIVAVILAGAFPSIAAAQGTPYSVLRGDLRAGAGSASRRRVRQGLVASQIALAVIMLTGAALLARSLQHLLTMNLGYEPAHLSVFSVTGPKSVFSSEEVNAVVGKQLITRMRAVPGVVSLTPIEDGPFHGQSFFISKIVPADQPTASDAGSPFIPFEVAGADYFRTYGIKLLRGRSISDADDRTAQHVVVINETLARRFWPHDDAIGKRVRNVFDTTGTLATVVGVVADTHLRELRATGPIEYIPWEQMAGAPFFGGGFAIRTTGTLAATLPAIRAAIHEVNPRIEVWYSASMDELLDAPLAQPRSSALLLSAFSISALLLAAIGLYGVMASLVKQQSRDFAIRVALGATAGNVRRLVLSDAMRVVAIGGAVGLVAALFGVRLLASQLFGVNPIDPLSIAAALLVLAVVALIAAYLPAERATRIDPAETLRAE